MHFQRLRISNINCVYYNLVGVTFFVKPFYLPRNLISPFNPVPYVVRHMPYYIVIIMGCA